MKTILVTGLDGSGKSTFFSRLAAAHVPGVELLFVPHINMQSLPAHSELRKTAELVDKLSAEADFRKEPRLKALSVFAAMLLFRELSVHLVKPGTQFLFCERHPLIDSTVYAHFYAHRMNPIELPPGLLQRLDEEYAEELGHLLRLLPPGIALQEQTRSGQLAEVIYQWFHVEKKTTLRDLEILFGVKPPDEIYFLQASAGVLYERIRHRKRLEPHESLEVLTRLNTAYTEVLNSATLRTSCKVSNVNAEDFSELDRFSESILTQIKS